MMSTTSSIRSRWCAIPLLAVLGVLATAAPATAEDERFHRFEAVATANFTVAEQCADGTTARLRVTVIGGHEEESQNDETTLDSDFLTVLLRGSDCEGFISDSGSGPAEFTFTQSLQSAHVEGTITTRQGRTVTVDMDWEGVGELETTHNVTKFPGFKGKFTSRRRDAVATGTVVVDGETLVDGSTTNAEIETLEDDNRTETPSEG